jgi:small-conductance mechanosensitive channel
MQLRHTEGAVHTIPYGEIPQVTNSSRDWVIVKMKFTVPFDTDMKKVKKIFKTIGAEIMQQPYAGDIIETFKLQGVGDVNDVGMVIRGKFKAKPNRQWVARKDIYSKIQQAFEQNGIEFARREVRVNVGGSHLDEAGRQQIAMAAADAVSVDVAAAEAVAVAR